MNRINDKATGTVTCPECGKKSKHPTIKIRRQQALLCPSCKSLFVVHSK
ncbi:YnfU family zinc-binding protein [Enterobacteriaceae bacterium H18W14]|nr:YnfU family zinc-binding protein [Dryocola boscaweniae]